MSMKVYSRRAGFMGIASKPVEIEYLEGTGTQYIDTGIINVASVIITMEEAIEGKNCLCGSEATSYRFKWGTSGSNNIYYGYGNSNIDDDITPTLADKYLFHMESKNQYVKDASGNVVISSKETLSRFSTSPIYLFRLKSGSSFVAMTGTIRIYYCKIWKNSALVRDYIPVRVGSTGYLYDRVSGQLFGNAGTGKFILGPDVKVVGGVNT